MRRVWALADTHLGAAVGKTMDRFGAAWEGHAAKIADNCHAVVGPEDLLLLPGDLSWAMRPDEAIPDLAFLADLPGTKIAIKGNHDYWWPSSRPIGFPGLHSPPFVLPDESVGIAGTRGWFEPISGSPDEDANRKILERERGRLRRSLDAIAHCERRIAMLHYPPHPYLPQLQEAGVEAVAYGHLHLGSPPEVESIAHVGEDIGGIRFYCVACDRIGFSPRLVATLG